MKKADTIMVATKTVEIKIEESFGKKPIEVEMTVPDQPQLMDPNDADLKLLSYSAKEVADKYYDLIAGNYNLKKPDTNPDSGFKAYIALAGLTCEIYFKAILFHVNGITAKHRRTHDLSRLFCMVDYKRCDIAELIIKCVANNDRDYFKKELERSKTIFNEFRYSYELNGYTLNLSFVIRLLTSLKHITDELFSK